MRTLLVGAGAHTLAEDRAGPAPRALVIDGETVAWVGAEPAQAPSHDRAVDLGGAWITPAFVDAHVHATATGLALRGVDLDGAGSAPEALDRLRRHAEAHADQTVIIGVRWDDLRWPEGRPMTATEVSAAARGRTVLLNRVDAHSCVVDAGTLARLPLERLEGVDRDAAGAPTGWLVEAASQVARALVYGALPAVQLAAAREAVCARAASLGIGSLHEMGHPGLSSLEDARTWAQGSWPIEVLVWWADLDAAVSAENGLRPGGDLFLDGSIGSRTAAVSFGYRGGGHGTLFHDDQAVAAFFSDCTAAGRAAGVHAIGDRAIEQAVAALEAAVEQHGIDAVRRCRHRVEHVELPRQDHIARLAALGIVASVQPVFDALWGGEGQLYDERFGADVALGSNPFARLHRAGVPLAFGSDSTVTPLDPWGAVHAAEHHRGGQGIDRLTALRAHVCGGRLAAGQPDGALRAGGRADLAIWNDDPLTVGDPRDLECLATIVGGRTAHGDLVVG